MTWLAWLRDRGALEMSCTECGSTIWLVQQRTYAARGASIYASGHYGICANCGSPAILQGTARVPRWARERAAREVPQVAGPMRREEKERAVLADQDLKWPGRKRR